MIDLKKTVVDRAEHNAFFPSEYSLSQYVAKKTDFDGFKFDKPYTGGKHKVLMVASDERYLEMKNGKLFSTGNHPVETLLPMLHIHHAGFEIEVATLSGNSVKFEMWAMPTEDKAVTDLYETYLPKFKNPHKLADILVEVTAEDSPYLGVLIPGGHAALHGLPFSTDMKAVVIEPMPLICSAPLVLAQVSGGGDELLNQPAVCAVDFYAVQACVEREFGGMGKVLHHLRHFVAAHFAHAPVSAGGDGAESARHQRIGTAARVGDLGDDFRALFV